MTTADESDVEEILERMASEYGPEQDLIAALYAIACTDMTAAQMRNTAIAALVGYGAMYDALDRRP